MMNYFDRFENQITITGELVTETPLHIGASEDELFGVDNQVMKTVDGKPIIPGSSLKGILRTYMERIGQAGILDHGEYKKPCITSEKMCLTEVNNKEKRNQLKEISEEHYYDYIATQSCPICHLFGNPLRAAKVSISDSTVKGNWINQYEVRMGVSIDRDTGTAVKNALYDFEVVPASTVFTFEVQCENVSPLELRWLLIGLESLRKGNLKVGGKVARGLGKIHGENWEVQVIDKENFFTSILDESAHRKSFDTFLKETLSEVD